MFMGYLAQVMKCVCIVLSAISLGFATGKPFINVNFSNDQSILL